jgi:hypothetical protein
MTLPVDCRAGTSSSTGAACRATIRRVLLVEDGERLSSATRNTCRAVFERRSIRVCRHGSGSTAVAYVVLSVAAHEWWIEACGDRDPSGHRIGCILQALLARDVSSAPPLIRGWLPADRVPPQTTVASRERSTTTVMAAVIGGNSGSQPLSATDALFWPCDVF